ncbi:MAG: L-threonylcarbamoyladenylate synthase, partial [Candidatus Limnocylindrales bacterium]
MRLDDGDGLAAAVEVLLAGGLVVLPTDTVYGLAVALATPDGVEKLFAAKHRPPEKAIIVLVDGLDQVAGIVELPPAAGVLAGVGWPGGLTLVLPLIGGGLPPALTAGTETLGVRVPDHPTPRALARLLGPLPTTSANRSGEPAALTAAEATAYLGAEVDLILDGGLSTGGVASTVVDCTGPRPSIIRAGAIGAEIHATAHDELGIAH